eukprot:1160317-Pelagomonas_calceolata.AAC.5
MSQTSQRYRVRSPLLGTGTIHAQHRLKPNVVFLVDRSNFKTAASKLGGNNLPCAIKCCFPHHQECEANANDEHYPRKCPARPMVSSILAHFGLEIFAVAAASEPSLMVPNVLAHSLHNMTHECLSISTGARELTAV